jgi:hypothetical protein
MIETFPTKGSRKMALNSCLKNTTHGTLSLNLSCQPEKRNYQPLSETEASKTFVQAKLFFPSGDIKSSCRTTLNLGLKDRD